MFLKKIEKRMKIGFSLSQESCYNRCGWRKRLRGKENERRLDYAQ